MSRLNNNSVRPIQKPHGDTSRQINDANLAQVPGAGKRPGLERFHGCHAADESYYAQARMKDRLAHEKKLQEQIRRVDELMT